jgi:hypothetical protein
MSAAADALLLLILSMGRSHDDGQSQKCTAYGDGHGHILIFHDLLPHFERGDPFKNEGRQYKNDNPDDREDCGICQDFKIDEVHIFFDGVIYVQVRQDPDG